MHTQKIRFTIDKQGAQLVGSRKNLFIRQECEAKNN